MINHVFCTCGGVIQVNKRIPNFYCQKCNREYEFEEIRYDRLLCNIMTGWIFPVIEDDQMLKSIVNRLEQMKEKRMENLKIREKLLSICETYQTTPSKNGKGTFFFTDCGNQMYSVKDEYAYNKKICPKCGKTLLLRGTYDAIAFMDWKNGKLKF